MSRAKGQPGPHESAHLHVTGAARYVADDPGPAGTLWALPVPSPAAAGRIVNRNAAAARAVPGVRAVLFAEDVPGDNLWGPIVHTEPLLAESRVDCMGQAVALVIAETEAAARAGVKAVVVEIASETPVLDIDTAIAADRFHTPPHVIARGDLDAAFARADLVIESELRSPAQDHFYLETQAALALPGEDGTWTIRSSTQHPTEIQKVVAATLGIPASRVVCEVPRLGGGFGGKESQASPYAAFAALGAHVTGQACRCWLHRHQDMAWTGKRHPFLTKYRAAFDREGTLIALDARLYSDGGWSVDLSGPVMDRALFHANGAYFVENIRLKGRVCATNLPSNTAFRGFGGPQGVLVVEDAIARAAETLERDPTALRLHNMYGPAPRNTAPFGQEIAANRLPRLAPALLASSDYGERRRGLSEHNAKGAWTRRGLGFQPVCFGISFTASLLNQAGAMVLVYTDGSVQVNHGGTEMGQGLHTKIRAIAADGLGIPPSAVRLMKTATDKVPNTSATAASSGTDLNGAAVARACETLRERMRPVAADLLGGAPLDTVIFRDGRAHGPDGAVVPFAQVANACWARQISLASTGYYATPGIAYDADSGRGRPFFYFAFGGAVSEVEVNGLTGEYRVQRVDILHDVGRSLAPDIDRGQVEGGFVQGMGWLTCEDPRVDASGRPLTTGPSTYKIPAVGDVPLDFRVDLLPRASNEQVVGGSKAVGEPPFLLAISVISALRDAIASFGPGGLPVELTLPATPEAVLRAIEHQREAGRAAAHAAR
ncbi:MAG: xanthine dehydrogenase molybdopterin binding subunit [Myxococcota bacterium]|nr:xanthine dehydrogenase molybdopterin binding subunit [Myxococcota bacterium]